RRAPTSSTRSTPTTTSYERAPSSTRTVSSLVAGITAASAPAAIVPSPRFHRGTNPRADLLDVEPGRVPLVRRAAVHRHARRQELADARQPLDIRSAGREQRSRLGPS